MLRKAYEVCSDMGDCCDSGQYDAGCGLNLYKLEHMLTADRLATVKRMRALANNEPPDLDNAMQSLCDKLEDEIRAAAEGEE